MRFAFPLLMIAAISWLECGVARAAGSTAIPDEVTHLRDPFKRPAMVRGAAGPRSDLELYALDKFKLVAVMTGPQRLRAMVEAPNSKTYLVFENMRIGLRKGIIRKISPDAIHVREQVVNVLGQEESVDSEIRMAEGTDLGKINPKPQLSSDAMNNASTGSALAPSPSTGVPAEVGAGMATGAGAGSTSPGTSTDTSVGGGGLASPKPGGG